MPLPRPADWPALAGAVLARDWLAPAGAVLAAAGALLAPPACVACRRPPARPGDPLCPACRAAMPGLCALPAPCGTRCPMAGGAIARAWTPVAFEGPARAVVHALKFRGALGLADLMAAQMVATAPAGLLAPGVALVPVPTPPARRRRRGDDHRARLAAAIGDRTGLEVVRCRPRTGPATRQAGARRAARLADGRVRLAVCKPVPRRVVLVDDVHTTGATIDACARKLRANGAFSVVALAYARALR
jgi:predicted amidophosphoribosyltransferase